MTPDQFKAWRKALDLKQKDAAERLGLKKRMIQYYETGKRDGKKVDIPKTVRLACYALQTGIFDFDGVTPALEAAPKADGAGEGSGAQKAALKAEKHDGKARKGTKHKRGAPDGAADKRPKGKLRALAPDSGEHG